MSRAKFLLSFLLVCALAMTLAGQGTSNITGTVNDESGAAVSGAKVVITHEDTGVKYEGTTTSAGVFAFS